MANAKCKSYLNHVSPNNNLVINVQYLYDMVSIQIFFTCCLFSLFCRFFSLFWYVHVPRSIFRPVLVCVCTSLKTASNVVRSVTFTKSS